MSLTDILSGNARQAANAQIGGIRAGEVRATERLDTGRAYAEDYGNRALGEFGAYSPGYAQANQMYLNSLGLNGEGGNAAAREAYKTSPAYQFNLDQGLQALERSAGSRGMLASGNTSADILQYAQGLASQDYGNWQSQLGGLGQLGLNAAGQRAGIQQRTGFAGLDNYGSLAQLGWGAATGIGNAQAQQARAEGEGLSGVLSSGLALGTKLLSGGGL